jgi:hypothetical protein
MTGMVGSEREEATETVESQTTPAEEQATTTEMTAPAGVEPAGTDLGKVRDLVLKAHPDVVPDLVRGGSVDELIASVEPARSAYQRIADQVRGRGPQVTGDHATESTVAAQPGATVPAATIAEGSTTSVVQPPVVPAGGASNAVDPGDLAPTSKIAQALAARRKK